MKDMIKKVLVWVFAALGAALTAAGVISAEAWAEVTGPLIEGLAGVGALIVGGLIAKIMTWITGKFGGESVG